MLSENENRDMLKILNALEEEYDKNRIIDDYISSFSWRDNSNISESFTSMV